jgi:hypothetical protein
MMAQLVETLRYKMEGGGVQFLMVSLEFFIDIHLATHGPGFDSNRNEYQEY